MVLVLGTTYTEAMYRTITIGKTFHLQLSAHVEGSLGRYLKCNQTK